MNISQMSPESIPMLSTVMSSARLSNEIGVAMMAKAIDVTQDGSAAMLDMMKRSMELSVNPSVGAGFDVTI